ncbi:hypothetical protein [Thermococcus sp.]
MVLRLAYPGRVVIVEGGEVLVFDGRLHSAPLEDVLRSAHGSPIPLPPEVREVAGDVARVLNDHSRVRGGSRSSLKGLAC